MPRHDSRIAAGAFWDRRPSECRPAQKANSGGLAGGARGLLICCSDYRCSHWTRINADQRAHCVQLSDFEPGFVSTACP
jgi:hypothetical protein